MAKNKRARGFTLIEMMVVGAIVAVVMAMAVTGYAGIAERNAPQNAAYDLSAAFSKARARAAERNTNVWVIFWTEGPSITGGGVTQPGAGAWALYEDKDLTFKLSQVPNYTDLAADPYKNNVLQKEELKDYPKRNVVFGVPAANTTARDNMDLDTKDVGGTTAQVSTKAAAMFSLLSSRGGCSFCDGSGATRRGAVVFTPDGEAKFVTSTDAVTYPPNGGKIMMTDRSGSQRAFLFSISQATSYVTFASN